MEEEAITAIEKGKAKILNKDTIFIGVKAYPETGIIKNCNCYLIFKNSKMTYYNTKNFNIGWPWPLLFLALLGCQSPKFKKSLARTNRPNILFIMTDDHTKQAMSLYDSKLINTPNLDRIGLEGIRFNRSYVTNSICGPSRAVLLTGKYSHKNGFKSNTDVFDSKQQTFPALLQQGGYYTAVVGKWHLKNHPAGFDYWNILTTEGFYYNPDFIRQGDTIRYEGYATDIINQLAIEAIENRDNTKPFCLLYHHMAPHRNWMPALEDLALFEDQEFPVPVSFNDTYENRTSSVPAQDMRVANMFLSYDMKLPNEAYQRETGTGGMAAFDAPTYWERLYKRMSNKQRAIWNQHYDQISKRYKSLPKNQQALEEWKYQRYMRDYLKCVVSVDRNVGKILDYLDEKGLAENTLVVYTSDQGFYLGEHGWYDKRFMYEESFSMPLVMRYPKGIKPGIGADQFVLNLDFAATFLDFAGLSIPSDIQGQSLRPICEGNIPNDWRKSVYYHYYQSHGWHQVAKHYGVRTDRYKLICYYEKNEWELYDLQQDPHELTNVYANENYSETRSYLKKELKRLQAYYDVDVF